ncbi:hypothetical protein BCM02_10138 [Paenibacillus methanolicus]|uniref:Beta-L-arabinofuranosidase (Glycosyl hydrolase family 127) n=1 Tax=Paenibacillus methanolicus TaxID=582686 RepID=A0A5S5CIS6_9BACL|nr:hypothetical protein BCM02_10138 [Paenibacillus methanolicus]
MYLFSGMTDLAAAYDDDELLKVCIELWNNVTRKRMYITGGVGSNEHWESFTVDYDLPNDRAYTETCAAISLLLWASRMLQSDADRDYADVMERVLYNGILSGISLDGKGYFYVNPLEVWPTACDVRDDLRSVARTRQSWFGCACCPPNIARLLASLGQYVYGYDEDASTLFVHLYMDSRVKQRINDQEVELVVKTAYPWDEAVSMRVSVDRPAEWMIALRLPGWCKRASLKINGEPVNLEDIAVKGYAKLYRVWKEGDQIELELPMPVEKVRAHPKVRENAGRMALQRGPIVYCVEQADNGENLRDLRIPADAEWAWRYDEKLLDGVVLLTGEGLRSNEDDTSDNWLYRTAPNTYHPVRMTAIPYYAWANREPGEMLVWLQEA